MARTISRVGIARDSPCESFGRKKFWATTTEEISVKISDTLMGDAPRLHQLGNLGFLPVETPRAIKKSGVVRDCGRRRELKIP